MNLVELDEFLGLKETLEMFHLPHAGDDEDRRLSDCPPQHSLIGALTCLTKPLFTVLHNNTYTT